ncbi:MAG: hypothetical protein WA885_01870 [Phormidesmis sp.]
MTQDPELSAGILCMSNLFNAPLLQDMGYQGYRPIDEAMETVCVLNNFRLAYRR